MKRSLKISSLAHATLAQKGEFWTWNQRLIRWSSSILNRDNVSQICLIVIFHSNPWSFCNLHHYQICGRVMFLHLCVILFTEGMMSVPVWSHVPRSLQARGYGPGGGGLYGPRGPWSRVPISLQPVASTKAGGTHPTGMHFFSSPT